MHRISPFLLPSHLLSPIMMSSPQPVAPPPPLWGIHGVTNEQQYNGASLTHGGNHSTVSYHLETCLASVFATFLEEVDDVEIELNAMGR